MRNRLVLPLPFGPVSWTNVPGDTDRSSPLKSLRSPRTQPSLLTSNILFVLRRDCSTQARITRIADGLLPFSAGLNRTLCAQPLIPSTLQNAHALEAARL